jgi:hypothetical protein
MIPARFLKDATVSADAKLLWAVIGAFADGRTGYSFVSPSKLESILRWGRRKREKSQKELCALGWLRLECRRGSHGRFARRTYRLCDPFTTARFEHCGENAQYIIPHSQSQVKSSIPTSLTYPEKAVNSISEVT